MGGLADFQRSRADDAALAPAAADQRRMAGHAAARGQNAGRGAHALDVLGIGLLADHDHGFALLRGGDRLFAVEDDPPDRAARPRRKPLGDHFKLLFGFRIEDRVEQFVELRRRDPHHRGLFVDHLLAEHIHRHIQRCGAGALADAALQHEELALLNGEFDIEHIVVMGFKLAADVEKLPVQFRIQLLHRLERLILLIAGVVVQRIRGAGSGDHVLALRIDQPFAVELVVAGRRIAGERHAGRGSVAHIAENHALHVHRGAPLIRNAFDPAVGDRLFAVPAFQHRADAAPELGHRIVRELLFQRLSDLDFELIAQQLQVIHSQVGVGGVAALFLQLLHHAVKLAADRLAFSRFDPLGLLHHHVGIHHDQPPVGVVHEPLVAGFRNQPRNRFRRKADVQHRLHHARHRTARTGATGDQQWVLRIAELHSHRLFHFGERVFHLLFHSGGQFAAVSEIIDAALGGNREAGRHRQPQRSHFRQIRAFAAEQFLHRAVALRLSRAEGIHILLFRHDVLSL